MGHDHVAAAGTAVLWRARRKAYVVSCLLVIGVLVLFLVPQLSTPRNTIDTRGVAYLREHLGTGRFLTLGPIAPNYGSYFGLASIGLNDFPPTRLDDFTKSKLSPPDDQPATFLQDLPVYEKIGVKYLVTPPGSASVPDGPPLASVYSDAVMNIHALPNPKPYFETPADDCRLEVPGRERLVASCCPWPCENRLIGAPLRGAVLVSG